MDLSSITLDTATVLTAGGLVVAAYGAIWGIKHVITVFRR